MRAVIFDVGRVLVHWDPDATLTGLAEISRASRAELQQILRQTSPTLGRGTLSVSDFHRLLIDQAGASQEWPLFYQAFCRGLRRDDAALSYAAQLAGQGAALGIISNTNAIHVQWLHDHLPELSCFRAVVWSSDAGLLKPEPAIYTLAVRQMEIAPADALFIDDLEENVAGAAAAGLAGQVHQSWTQTRAAVEQWLRG